MFKIAESTIRSRFRPLAAAGLGFPGSMMDQFCISEEWSVNLVEGTICLGEHSSVLHGLTGRFCGLTGLVRAYDPSDRHHIIGLFEQAAANPSTFCFSSTIRVADGQRQPVFCVAESLTGQESTPLTLSGIFLYPRFRLDKPRLSLLDSPIAHFA